MYIGDSYKGYGADNLNLVISELRQNDSGYIRNKIDHDYDGSYDEYHDDDPDIFVESY